MLAVDLGHVFVPCRELPTGILQISLKPLGVFPNLVVPKESLARDERLRKAEHTARGSKEGWLVWLWRYCEHVLEASNVSRQTRTGQPNLTRKVERITRTTFSLTARRAISDNKVMMPNLLFDRGHQHRTDFGKGNATDLSTFSQKSRSKLNSQKHRATWYCVCGEVGDEESTMLCSRPVKLKHNALIFWLVAWSRN